jgi:hypothetical protein
MSIQSAFPETPAFVISRQPRVLEGLCALREEWEAAVEGSSLLDVTASVGLLLFDVATKLRLTPEERSFFLGARLTDEVTALTGEENTP